MRKLAQRLQAIEQAQRSTVAQDEQKRHWLLAFLTDEQVAELRAIAAEELRWWQAHRAKSGASEKV
jgi:hypothetical protein